MMGGGFKKSVFKIKDFLLKLSPSVYLWTEGGLGPCVMDGPIDAPCLLPLALRCFALRCVALLCFALL